MRISVIVPCYKDSATLSRALDSILVQSRAADEILVVNDASPESLKIEQVLQSYPNVRYFVNPHNLGLAATRNLGVKVATGDVITFLDADDELHPQKIEMQFSFYRPDRAISCRAARIGDERGTDRVLIYKESPGYTVSRNSSNLVRGNKNLVGASLMISRQLFLANDGYDTSLRSCEDFDLWLRLLDQGIPVFNINLPLYLYRINENGLSSNSLSISYWELAVVKKYYASCYLRKGSSNGEAGTLAIWLFKHFVRYEQCRDPKLLAATVSNLVILDSWPITQSLLIVARALGLPKFIVWLRSVRDLMTSKR